MYSKIIDPEIIKQSRINLSQPHPQIRRVTSAQAASITDFKKPLYWNSLLSDDAAQRSLCARTFTCWDD